MVQQCPPPPPGSSHSYLETLTNPRRLLQYIEPEHKKLPHVIRFSGGRSSAMMTLALCEAGLLNQKRGDVVVFCNTSAEHPNTYKFVKHCKQIIEEHYQIPFFCLEYQTYEDSHRGKWTRTEGYKLVKALPIEEDPDGYRWKGEAFEEMVSYAGMLPSRFIRSCTSRLKIHPTHSFLEEWFGGNTTNSRRGHHRKKSYLNREEIFAEYQKNGGLIPRDEYIKQKRYLWKQPTFREKQKWDDFTDAPTTFSNSVLEEKSKFAGKISIWGKSAAPYISLLGLRADESLRISKILNRTIFAFGATSSSCQVKTQPPFEYPYFPLAEVGTNKKEVFEFWAKQDFDLNLDSNLGNCTFCFMKGQKALPQLSQIDDPNKVKNTPSDFKWWVRLEEKYKRRVPTRNGNGDSSFGFFGKTGVFYKDLQAVGESSTIEELKPLACDCTD